MLPLVCLGILLSVFGLLATCSFLFVWAFLVLGSFSLCSWLKPKVPASSLVLYFVVSVLGSLLFLLSCVDSHFYSLVLQLSLLLKLGLAPFQFWVFCVLSHLRPGPLCFFLGPCKLGLLFLFVNIGSPCLILASASLLVGFALIWLSSRTHVLLYASGSSHLILLLLLGPSCFYFYYLTYLLSLFLVFLSSTKYFSPLLAFSCLGGLPPLTMFWAKVFALLILPSLWSFFFLLVSLILLWPYIHCGLTTSSSGSSSPLLILISIVLPCYFGSFAL